jgi:hypothetical protein
MLNASLREELLAMRAEDLRVRQELLDSGDLGGAYVPRMEAVHIKNAGRLKEIIERFGWPDEQISGEDGAEAAWLIVQHAIGFPDLQRECLQLMRHCVTEGRIPGWQAAYLEDRIAMLEGRPQRYATQWMDDPIDGRARPWKLAEPDRVDELRATVGLERMHPIPEPGPELPVAQQEGMRANQRWWEDWLGSRGWRS